MGYCMSHVGGKFFIANKDKINALKAIKELAKKQDGFRWVDNSEFAESKTIEEALGAWRWDTDVNNDGDITSLSFTGEKMGDDITLFEAIAPYVKRDSIIEMSGEDGMRWAWYFDGEKCIERDAIITYR